MSTSPRRRRFLKPELLLWVVLAVALAVFALWRIPTGDYIFLPDHAHPVAPLVDVAGGHEPRNGGGIYFVDVLIRKATLLEELFGGLENGATLYAPSQVVPPGITSAQEGTVDLSGRCAPPSRSPPRSRCAASDAR